MHSELVPKALVLPLVPEDRFIVEILYNGFSELEPKTLVLPLVPEAGFIVEMLYNTFSMGHDAH